MTLKSTVFWWFETDIFVVPDKNLIAVFTSTLSAKDQNIPTGFLYSNIIPAVRSGEPLPENPEEENELNNLAALWQKTGPVERDKIREKSPKVSTSMLPGEYVNDAYGFTARYDPKLVIADPDVRSPVIFRKKAVGGLPIFGVAISDIPPGMALKDSGDYIMGVYKKAAEINTPEFRKQEIITLPDGTRANYVEITWRYRWFDMLTVAVMAFRGDKIIGAAAVGTEKMPAGYLADMAKSLRFEK